MEQAQDSPVSNSSENRYTFWCDAHEQRRHYYSCIGHIIPAYERGTLDPSDPINTCAVACRVGKCKAMEMRQEELDAGQAIYFTQRSSFGKVERSGGIASLLGKRGDGAIPTAPRMSPLPNVGNLSKKDGFGLKNIEIASVINKGLEDEKNEMKEKIISMKLEILELAKTDKAKAMALLQKVKELEGKA